MGLIERKKCSKCKTIKNINEFYYTKKKYFFSYCKACATEYTIKWYQNKKANIEYKKCTRCDSIKDIKDFYLTSCYCKKCTIEYNVKWRQSKKIPIELNIERRKCSKCKTVKKLEEFYYNSNTKNYFGYCKTCTRAYTAKWHKNNPYKTQEEKKRAKIF